MTPRLAIAASTCVAIPILVAIAYLGWNRASRRDLPHWRNGAGLASMFIIFALWLVQATRWFLLSKLQRFSGFLGPDWLEVETFLPAYYAYPALLLAFALKEIPRLQMIGAWFLLALFYGTFWYT
jgi:hypothetical protein